MRRVYIAVMCLALLLSASIPLIYQHADRLSSWIASLSKNCPLSDKVCLTMLLPTKQLFDVSLQTLRQQITKEELPVLNIYMSDAALQKLSEKRFVAINKERSILLTEDDDWVSASIVVDNGEAKKVKTELRLKGDWADHLKHPSKWSFRIKVKDDYILGMKRLSLQNPLTRNYHYETMLLGQMRQLGILAPRYFFVDVYINDYKLGVMALEEHFSKELVESQNRREGPILAYDEDIIWQQRNLNYNVSYISNVNANLNGGVHHYKGRDLAIKEFRQANFKLGTIETNNSIRGQSLFRDYVYGKLPADQVFDMALVSKWWVLTNFWGACHGAIHHNRRYYYNPITDLLEPISFDNQPKPKQFEYCMDPAVKGLLASKEFVDYVKKDIQFFSRILFDAKYENEFYQQQKKLQQLLATDFELSREQQNTVPNLDIDQLRANLFAFLNVLVEKYDQFDNASLFLPSSDSIRNPRLLKLNVALYSHLRTFAFFDKGKLELELKNLTLNPISIVKIAFVDINDREALTINENFTLPVYIKESKAHIKTLRIDHKGLYPEQKLLIHYTYQGKPFTQVANLQFRNHINGFEGNFFTDAAQISENILIDERRKRVIFPKGDYIIEKSYMLPRHWSVVIMSGARISFKQGALLKLQGPLFALGLSTEPILINISSNNDFHSMGAWGGILVIKSQAQSLIKHTFFEGDPQIELANRQDFYGLTGCISFYESDIDILNTSFNSMQCEDAINIIRSNFTLSNLTITNAQADAFDSDFSKGSITDSIFTHVTNDAIDVSGTDIYVNNVSFDYIGDKAISVGEKSSLTAYSLDVNHASTGIASKDLSSAVVNKAIFKEVTGTGLITYIKKTEYGPASIQCYECVFENVTALTANQYKSSITLNGEVMLDTSFTSNQMAEAGYSTN